MRSRPLVVIRGRRESDAGFILELGREAFSEYSASASGYTAHMAATAHTLIAEHDEVAVGLAIIDLRAGRAHLAAIAVRTDWRGLGIGRSLLRAAERAACDRGAVEMELTTADSTLAASVLFLRNGYRRRARHTRYYARGQHAIEMFKPFRE